MAWINVCVKHVLEITQEVVHGDYIDLTRTWSHGFLGIWFTQGYLCPIINLVAKTRYGTNMKKIDGEN